MMSTVAAILASSAGERRVDRATMVVLIDELENKGLVQRRPHPEDRRKNVVALTGPAAPPLTRVGPT
jgi:DNA-binding MarR family transcriptional regulator